jgi:stage V sporulation protein AD
LFFDSIIEHETWGEKSWEKAESKLLRETFSQIVSKAAVSPDKVNYIIAGDLLNQCISSSFGLRESGVPFFGIYGACSTMAESISLGSMLIDGEFADKVVCLTSSHFCSAEKQFRFPLELGSQRPPTAQWTVTGAGGVLLSGDGAGPYITYITTGKIVDMGVKDANNMGGAMAPAAVDTILTHFKDTGLAPEYYDLIVTGDLGAVGKSICEDFLRREGYYVGDRYNDCGLMIFDRERQDTHAGGSGCGCSAITFASFIMNQLRSRTLKRVLFVPTGALLSQVSYNEGNTIPCIAHAVIVEAM